MTTIALTQRERDGRHGCRIPGRIVRLFIYLRAVLSLTRAGRGSSRPRLWKLRCSSSASAGAPRTCRRRGRSRRGRSLGSIATTAAFPPPPRTRFGFRLCGSTATATVAAVTVAAVVVVAALTLGGRRTCGTGRRGTENGLRATARAAPLGLAASAAARGAAAAAAAATIAVAVTAKEGAATSAVFTRGWRCR